MVRPRGPLALADVGGCLFRQLPRDRTKDDWGVADAGGTTRVTFDGRTVEYRGLDELGQALAALHGAENSAARRPPVTMASFSRGGSA